MTANEALNNVKALISDLEDAIKTGKRDSRIRDTGRSYKSRAYSVRDICDEVGIVGWCHNTVSLSQLKQMKSFLTTAIKLGYTGYVCFVVGDSVRSYNSHGMWAYKENEAPDRYSDRKGAVLFHSFRSGDNYWDACDDDGVRFSHKYYKESSWGKFTLEQIKKLLA